MLAALMLMMACQVSRADIIEIATRAQFNVLASGQTTITFESLAVPTNSFVNYGSSIVLDGVTFADSRNEYGVNGSAFGPGDRSTYLQGDGHSSQNVTLPTLVSAVGSDIFNTGSTPETETGTVTDSTGATFNFSAIAPAGTGSPSVAFLGFLDTTPGATIESIVYDSPADQELPALDNFSFGTAVAAPLPSAAAGALPLLGGLGLITLARRRVVGA
jgi:hypothetical protein